MRKIFFILLVFTLVLSACAAKQTEEAAQATETPIVAEATSAQDDPQALPTSTIIASSGPATCSVSKIELPVPVPDDQLSYPPITVDDLVEGNDDTLVTFLEYSDFQCPYCAVLEPALVELYENYPDEVRLVFRHFPLTSIHDKAILSSQAAEAADRQDKFFEMKNLLFAGQNEWSSLTDSKFREYLNEQAKSLDLNMDQFRRDLDDKTITDNLNKARDEAIELGLQGTPSLFINGIPFDAYQPAGLDYQTLENIFFFWKNIETVQQTQDSQFNECPPQVTDPESKYIATIETEKGDIKIELYPDKAPTTVNSFVFLAEQGWYDNMTFHRVIKTHVAQSGDPTGTGFGTPGYVYGLELDPELRFDQAGVVGMANSGPDANGSQFFITYNAIPDLDGRFTVFGKVIEGMDVLNKLSDRDTSTGGGNLPPGDKIITITIQEQ